MTPVRKPTNSAHDPLVREFVNLADQVGISLSRVAIIAGMPTNVPYRWNTGARATIPNFQAALNALGYRLEIVPIDQPKKENHHDPEAKQ